MIKRKWQLLFFPLVLFMNSLFAQEQVNIKFGKITQSDFQISAPKSDTGANAVIIADFGKTSFAGNGKSFFSLVMTHYTRVKILNKNGFGQAEYNILLANDRKGSIEKIIELKGSTFNLENGVIQETKLDNKSIFPGKASAFHDRMKFSMPALKVGSIFELTYTIKSNFYTYPFGWTFQHDVPCMWSEYDVIYPSMYHYLISKTGDPHFDIETMKQIFETYSVQDNTGADHQEGFIHVATPAIQSKWVKKNVPALREQPYVSTIDNYRSKISFKLNFFQQDEETERGLQMYTWDTVCRKLLIREDFGFELNQDNHWMDTELKDVATGSLSPTEEIRRIYQYVRDNFHCTDTNEIFVETSLKDVFKKRSGNVGELNLLLVALLRHQNIPADPAILSTRENGIATWNLPLTYEYNYLICVVYPFGERILLDAGRPFNSYAKLPPYCYNWGARLINEKDPLLIPLIPDSLTEKSFTSVMFINDEKGVFTGTLKTIFGDYEAYEIREKVKKSSEGQYFKELKTGLSEFEISNESFDSLNHTNSPLGLHYDLDLKNLQGGDIIYFNPVFTTGFSTNPFTAEERLFPVEMPNKIDRTYLLSMEIPKGFRVDELPKSARVKLNENQGIFEYLIQQNQDNIQMRVHLKLNQATFPTDEYATLRDFFAYVVKKESEQVVFKKIH
jgi:hypothetical protein